MFVTVFYERFRKVCCNTIVDAMDDVGEPENAVKRTKALVFEEELLETKSTK